MYFFVVWGKKCHMLFPVWSCYIGRKFPKLRCGLNWGCGRKIQQVISTTEDVGGWKVWLWKEDSSCYLLCRAVAVDGSFHNWECGENCGCGKEFRLILVQSCGCGRKFPQLRTFHILLPWQWDSTPTRNIHSNHGHTRVRARCRRLF